MTEEMPDFYPPEETFEDVLEKYPNADNGATCMLTTIEQGGLQYVAIREDDQWKKVLFAAPSDLYQEDVAGKVERLYTELTSLTAEIQERLNRIEDRLNKIDEKIIPPTRLVGALFDE